MSDISNAAKLLGSIKTEKKKRSSQENWKKAVASGNLGKKKKPLEGLTNN